MSLRMFLLLYLGVVIGLQTAQAAFLPKTTDIWQGEDLLPVTKAPTTITTKTTKTTTTTTTTTSSSSSSSSSTTPSTNTILPTLLSTSTTTSTNTILPTLLSTSTTPSTNTILPTLLSTSTTPSTNTILPTLLSTSTTPSTNTILPTLLSTSTTTSTNTILPTLLSTSTTTITPSPPVVNVSCAILKINETRKSTEYATNMTSDSSINTSLKKYAINSSDIEGNMTLVDKISNQVRIILKHFQGPELVGIPGQTIITEPLHGPDTNASLVLATGQFYNITIWGLSNFTINVWNTKLDDMEVYVELLMKRVLIVGNYTVNNMIASSGGPFNITLINVTAIATVDLATNDEGKLYSNNSVLDMAYKSLQVDLKEVNYILKPFMNSGGVAVLNAEKEHILSNMNERLIMEIDHRLEAFPRIPSLKHLSPVDLAIMEAKKFVASHFEPYIISNVIDFENPFIKVHAGPVIVHGISKFARVGNVTLAMANETVIIQVRIVTGHLFGNCKWFYDFGSVGVKRYGDSNFTVEHVQFEATIHQNVDSRRPPKLHDLDIETGPIRVRMDGRGHFDYLVEMVVKILPKMLRYTIIDALEEPLKHKTQSELLDKISVDKVVEENMNDIKKYLSDKL